MEKKKVYLETTLFSYYFDADRDAHADTVTLFDECAGGIFDPYTSDYVIREIEGTPSSTLRENMLSLIGKYDIAILEATDETDELAERYVADGALSRGSLVDASHIATVAVNDLDMIVSLNFRHIVKEKTIQLTNAINILQGYRKVKIKSPMEVIDSEKTRYNLR